MLINRFAIKQMIKINDYSLVFLQNSPQYLDPCTRSREIFRKNFNTYFYFFLYFISIFILLTRRKATEALIHRVGNYPDLLPEIPRYFCPLVIFFFFFFFFFFLISIFILLTRRKATEALYIG